MKQKELEIQRALGTCSTHWIEIQFPRGEEPEGLDQLMIKSFPITTRFYKGNNKSCFLIETPISYLKPFVDALTKLMYHTKIYQKGWVSIASRMFVWEFINGEHIPCCNFTIK